MLEKLNKKSIKYKLRRRTIENLKNILGFKGEGTQDSPIIIDDLGDVTVEISIVSKEIYLLLKNLTISKLSIADSQNVVIEECFIEELELVECRNLTFMNNTIMRIEQFLCRSCIYENNSILHKEHAKLINNTHERRRFVFVWIFLGVGILYTVFAAVLLVNSYFSLGSVVHLISGVLLLIGMTFLLHLRYQVNKIPQNKYLNFVIQEKAAFIKPLIKTA